MKKAATGLSCGGFTPSIAKNKRGAAMQSTEDQETCHCGQLAIVNETLGYSRGMCADCDACRCDCDPTNCPNRSAVLPADPDLAAEGQLVGRLLEFVRGGKLDWGDEGLAADTIMRLRSAFAAERDRADRAEARLNSLAPVLEMTQGTAHTILRSVLIGGVYAPEATA